MFVVDHILVSDDLADARFACALAGCRGACCVQGDSGAPLEEEELSAVESVIPAVHGYLSTEAQRIVDREGAWEQRADGRFATRCVDGRECVFVYYERGTARCSIQKAYDEGRTAFKKPLSCHLFPIRAESYDTYDVLNYERVGICDPGRTAGEAQGALLAEFLEEPLVRKYGEEWYDRFIAACAERREALAG